MKELIYTSIILLVGALFGIFLAYNFLASDLRQEQLEQQRIDQELIEELTAWRIKYEWEKLKEEN